MTIGLDPEFFVVDGSNRAVPAQKFLDSPTADVAFDNAAVEIRPEHSTCIQGFLSNVRETFRYAVMRMRLARLRGEIPSTSRISMAPAVRLHERDLSLPSVQTFGCSPSYLVTPEGEIGMTEGGLVNPSFPWRCAGYHVHVSVYSGSSMRKSVINGVTMADALIGLVDVMMVDKANPTWVRGSQIRRNIMGYGGAGEFRVERQPKGRSGDPIVDTASSYRVEYRTLSPWPLSHPLWSWWAQSAVRHAISWATYRTSSVLATLPNRSEIVEAINTCNAVEARRLWLAAVAAVGGGLAGRDGNDALTTRNLRRLAYCLRERGFETLTAGWSPERAWFKNIGIGRKNTYTGNLHLPNPQSSLRSSITPGQRELNKGQDGVRYFNIPGFTRHEPGKITTFPSGMENYFRLIENRPFPTDAQKPVKELL